MLLLLVVVPLVVVPLVAAETEVDVVILGGGIAGLATAYGLRGRASTLVIERGRVCEQGATFAAKQGHVYVGNRNDGWRRQSLDIYRDLEATAGIDLQVHGAATVGSGAAALASAEGSTFVDAVDGLYVGQGAAWDHESASVNPCKVLAAMRRTTRVWESTAVDEVAGRWHLRVNGTIRVRAKALVLALGVWRDAFVRQHFPTIAEDVSAVGAQIALYRPLRSSRHNTTTLSAASVFVYGPGSLEAKQASTAYFLTHDVDGVQRFDYVYAKAWNDVVAVGTRRQPLRQPADCDDLPFDAPLHRRAARAAMNVFLGDDHPAGAPFARYTACFPLIRPDGRIRARRLEAGLFELNGLAGGGIARAPAAGASLADDILAGLEVQVSAAAFRDGAPSCHDDDGVGSGVN